jgi:hypothetical protein
MVCRRCHHDNILLSWWPQRRQKSPGAASAPGSRWDGGRLRLFDFLDDRATKLALDECHAGRAGRVIGGAGVVGPFLAQARGRRAG